MGQRKKEKKKGKKNKKSRILIFTFAKDLPCHPSIVFFFFQTPKVPKTPKNPRPEVRWRGGAQGGKGKTVIVFNYYAIISP